MGHLMNRQLQSLYQNDLKQHYTQPLGQEPLDTPSHQFEGYNASCGDEILFSLKTSSSLSKILSIAFEGDSCAICTASASLLCEVTQSQSPESFAILHQWLDNQLSALSASTHSFEPEQKNDLRASEINQQRLNKLKPLLSVSQFPSRINCALLPWQTFAKALKSPIELAATLNESGCK
jgi:nitrogen fixation NifU-like protein